MEKKEVRNQKVDIVRGLGCIGVIIYHYTTHYNNNFPNHPLPFSMIQGASMVSLFFILSTFYLYKSAIKTTSAKTLIYERMTRLYPAYWCSVVVTSLILFLLKSDLLSSFFSIIANLTMVNSLLGIKSVDGVYWYLVYELIILAVFSCAITFKVNKSGEKIRLIDYPLALCLLWFALTIISRLILYFLKIESSQMQAILFGSKYVHTFIIGIIFSCMQKERERWHYIMLFLSVIYMYYVRNSEFIMVIIVISIVWLLLNNKLQFINSKFLKEIGKISYPLYLVHSMIGKALIIKLGDMGWTNWTNLLVPFTISLILAYIIHYYVEIQLICFIKKKFDSRITKKY